MKEFAVHFYDNGKRYAYRRMADIPRIGETLFFNNEVMCCVTDVAWCLNDDALPQGDSGTKVLVSIELKK